MSFSSILRSLIIESRLTQRELAVHLNIAPSTLGGYVQGKSEPDMETLVKIAQYFDVSTDYLLGIRAKDSKNLYEKQLLEVFRTMPPAQQEVFILQGRAIADYYLFRK